MTVTEKQELLTRIEKALDDVRPHLAVDGGDVDLMDITEDYRVIIQWKGACVNCSMSAMTLKAGLEQAIKSQVPEIKTVEAINGLEVA